MGILVGGSSSDDSVDDTWGKIAFITSLSAFGFLLLLFCLYCYCSRAHGVVYKKKRFNVEKYDIERGSIDVAGTMDKSKSEVQMMAASKEHRQKMSDVSAGTRMASNTSINTKMNLTAVTENNNT